MRRRLAGESCRSTVETHAQHRVAIIGAGWCGLQMLQSLIELGVECELFEKLSSVGGTFTPDLSYYQLQLHGARWFVQLWSHGKWFPFKQTEQKYLDAKATAQEMHEYITSYAKKNGLLSQISFNSHVTEVHYDSRSRRADIVVLVGGGASVRKGPYDLVVYASMSAKPHLPLIPNNGFNGKVIHSCEFKADVMLQIAANNSKVLVLGAGKSACDMMCALQSHSHANIIWLFRRRYWFFKYEAFFHNRSCCAMMKSVVALVCLLVTCISTHFSMFLMWVIGYITLPGSYRWPNHFDARRFHLGLVDKHQLEILDKIQPVVGDPSHLCQGGVALKNGNTLECDVVIYATGYETGLLDVRFVKDGQDIDIVDKPLYDHIVFPAFPCLLSATTAFFNFGPSRGVSLAQYISHVLESEPISEECMEKRANGNWCNQRSSIPLHYSSARPQIREWLLMNLDWMRAGILSPFEFVRAALLIFVLGKYTHMRLTVGKTYC